MMEDSQILELFRSRSQDALIRTQEKYGRYCQSIAFHILGTENDAEECVNDTLLRAWNAIPPEKPDRLSVFLGKITRNLALDRFRHENAEKRGGSQVPTALEELEEALPDGETADFADSIALRDALNRFLRELPEDSRRMFLMRYWRLCTISEVAEKCGGGESRVKMRLSRIRGQLKLFLEQEGIGI